MSRTVAPWEIPRELLQKRREKSDPGYGQTPEERPAEDYIRFGIINLDKPTGPTSHEVAAWVKRILNLQRVAHGGTLEA
jgi:H/ACA ribonucleoprotein complex subunit 4